MSASDFMRTRMFFLSMESRATRQSAYVVFCFKYPINASFSSDPLYYCDVLAVLHPVTMKNAGEGGDSKAQ